MKKNQLFIASIIALCFASCVTDPNSPGLEYMPDMYRSPAIEAYVDYGFDEFKPGMTADSAKEMRLDQSVRIPVDGTIPYRGADELAFNAPYPFPNTPEGYEDAGARLKSPLPTTEQNIAEGKVLFEKFCIQCHGPKGAGDGSITQKSGGKYPIVPSYESRKGLEEGKMFHTLTYGKGLMGSHAYIVDQKERWKLVQYVSILMNGEQPESEDAETPASNGDEGAEG